jgi:hypothetical protein
MNYWTAEWPEDQFKLESEHFRLFWIPDIYLSNAKTQFAPFQSIDTRFIDILITSASKHPEMLTQRQTFNECTFRYVWKFNAKISCDLNFQKYPIDVQNCALQFRSFSYPMTDLVINLVHVEADPGIQLGNQYLTIKYKQNSIWPRTGRRLKTIRGFRSLALVHMTFNRSIGSVFVGVMIPALLVVIIDLTMFWVRIDVISDRIGTGITCLFTLLTQFNATRSALAANSYVTLMDWFMIMCIGFVVLQMMQTILVYIVYNREKTRIAELDRRSREAEKKHHLWNRKEEQQQQNGQEQQDSKEKKKKENPDRLTSHTSVPSTASSQTSLMSLNGVNGGMKFRGNSTCSDFTTVMPYKRNMKANNLTTRRRRRIIYPTGYRDSVRQMNEKRKAEKNFAGADDDAETRSIHDQPQKSLEERLKEFRDFLLEPTARPGTAEYLPMKIDSISRIIIPFLFVFVMVAYGLLAASIDERT